MYYGFSCVSACVTDFNGQKANCHRVLSSALHAEIISDRCSILGELVHITAPAWYTAGNKCHQTKARNIWKV